MFGIVFHHFVWFNALDIDSRPWSFNRVLLEFVANPMGKVGAALFFLISAWFLCEAGLGVRDCLKRIWLMEREVLFWSFTLVILSVLFRLPGSSMKLVLKSMLPTLTGAWWYVTAYAMFLVLAPFLLVGLKALGQRQHQMLCIMTIVLWAVLAGVVPSISLGMSLNFVPFCFIFVLVSYWRWHGRPASRREGLIAFLTGFLLTVAMGLGASLLQTTTGLGPAIVAVTKGEMWYLRDLLMAFGLFIWFERSHFSNRAIDFLARSAFAIYLITEFPTIRTLLWTKLFDMTPYWTSPWLFISAAAGIALLSGACVLADLARRGLFALTVDRHRGAWFDRIWDSAVTLWVSHESSITSVH